MHLIYIILVKEHYEKIIEIKWRDRRWCSNPKWTNAWTKPIFDMETDIGLYRKHNSIEWKSCTNDDMKELSLIILSNWIRLNVEFVIIVNNDDEHDWCWLFKDMEEYVNLKL